MRNCNTVLEPVFAAQILFWLAALRKVVWVWEQYNTICTVALSSDHVIVSNFVCYSSIAKNYLYISPVLPFSRVHLPNCIYRLFSPPRVHLQQSFALFSPQTSVFHFTCPCFRFISLLHKDQYQWMACTSLRTKKCTPKYNERVDLWKV